MLESKRKLMGVKNTINQQTLLNTKMRLHSPWGKRLNWGPPFCSNSLLGWGGGGGKGLGRISKSFRCHLSLHRDSVRRTAAIKDLHRSNMEEGMGVADGKKDKWDVSSHVCLPKRIRLLAWEGEGQDCMDRVAGFRAAAPSSLCNNRFVFPSTVTDIAFYARHLHILLYNAVSESHNCLADHD